MATHGSRSLHAPGLGKVSLISFAVPHHTRDGVPGISTPPCLAAHLVIITFQGGGLFLDLERVVQDNIAPFGESAEFVALLGCVEA